MAAREAVHDRVCRRGWPLRFSGSKLDWVSMWIGDPAQYNSTNVRNGLNFCNNDAILQYFMLQFLLLRCGSTVKPVKEEGD